MLLERILTDLDADVFHPFLLLRKELPSGLVRNSKPVSLFQKNLLTIDRCMSTTIENGRDLLVFLVRMDEGDACFPLHSPEKLSVMISEI